MNRSGRSAWQSKFYETTITLSDESDEQDFLSTHDTKKKEERFESQAAAQCVAHAYISIHLHQKRRGQLFGLQCWRADNVGALKVDKRGKDFLLVNIFYKLGISQTYMCERATLSTTKHSVASSNEQRKVLSKLVCIWLACMMIFFLTLCTIKYGSRDIMDTYTTQHRLGARVEAVTYKHDGDRCS